MKEENGTRLTKNGRKIFTKTWLPEGMPRVNIILVHGLGEHCERYREAAGFLTGIGCAVYGFDHIGHGKSEGKRGCMSYADAFEIISSFKGELLEQFPDIPVLLYGQSMGGGIVLSYGTQHPEGLLGIITTSPAVGMADPLKPAAVKVLRTLKKVTPDLAVSNGLKIEGICHDQAIIDQYLTDPLCHRKISITLVLDILDWGNYLSAYDKDYPVPLFLAQGTEDRLVDPAAAEDFAVNLKGNVTYKCFEGSYHELHHEPEKQKLFDAIEAWIGEILSE